jgi:DNA-3-methyladenine glycosylase
MSKLPREFYLQKNVVKVASELLGKVLVTQFNGIITSGIICETEAYNGVVDKASHAYGGRRTQRTETMFQEGGIAYIYLCYGIHHLFNVVTNREDQPHAVLIRGIQPLDGIPEMLLRKRISIEKKNMGIGPGNVSTCLGLHTKLDKTDLLGDQIWIEDQGIKLIKKNIITSPRIGVDYAGEDAKLPYRFQYHF